MRWGQSDADGPTPSIEARPGAMKPTERIAEARTPDGTLLELWWHDGASLIRADGVERMSTRCHVSEDRFA